VCALAAVQIRQRYRDYRTTIAGSTEGVKTAIIVLGALHGPRCKTQPSYFSNQCPRTFAPKPAYGVRYWKYRKLKPPKVEMLAIIRKRAERFLSVALPTPEGLVSQRDSRKWVDTRFEGLFSWIITSPPYYGMRTYIPDQWLRYWFVGGPSTVDYSSRPRDFQHSSPEDFSKQLRSVQAAGRKRPVGESSANNNP
jgi:hypothetical protein